MQHDRRVWCWRELGGACTNSQPLLCDFSTELKSIYLGVSHTHTVPTRPKLRREDGDPKEQDINFYFFKATMRQVSLRCTRVVPGSFPWVVSLSKAMTVLPIRLEAPGTSVCLACRTHTILHGCPMPSSLQPRRQVRSCNDNLSPRKSKSQ